MSRSLFDPTARQEIRRRMSSIDPTRPGVWGKMSAAQMLAHLIASLKMSTGELPTKPKPSPLNNPLMRWLVIYVMPWPRGTPTAPELLPTDAGDWERDLPRFNQLLEQVGARRDAAAWPTHPVFGRLSGRDWGDLGYKHINHHLRQFGV